MYIVFIDPDGLLPLIYCEKYLSVSLEVRRYRLRRS